MNRKEFFQGSAGALGALALGRNTRGTPFRRLVESVSGEGEDAFWGVVRDQFILDPEWTYLNFGGLGSCPLPVLNSFFEWTRAEERAPSAGHDGKAWAETKDKLARLLGKSCRGDDLGLISSATEGINMIVNGLPLKQGDEVITSTHEHVAVHTALLNRMKRDGIVIRLFEPDLHKGLGNVDRIAGLMNGRTRLVFISHVTCTVGQNFPVKEISDLSRSRGVWFALDGAQAPVNVPFDIVECGVDFYTASTHKWVMGPKRTGFLYVRPAVLDVLRPLAVGSGSSERYDIRKNEFVLMPTVQRFEYGTQNDALFFALGKALDFIETIGLDRIQRFNRGLAEKFYAGLKDTPGVEIVSPAEEPYRSAMISFRMVQRDYSKIIQEMNKEKIRVRPVSEGGVNCVRVSFHVCNHAGEVDKILTALRKLA